MFGSDSLAQNTAVQVTLITTFGLIVVACIGVLTAKVTSNANRSAQANAEEASKSAIIAKDYAAALGAKDALVQALEDRVGFLEDINRELRKRIEDLELRIEENEEAKRAAHLIEHQQHQEIRELREELDKFKSQR